MTFSKQRSTSSSIAMLLAALMLFVAVAVGCQQGVREETLLFQEAEALYRAGDYDGASQRYDAFLDAYPRSPLSRTAKLRLRTIDREMESVMGTRGTNRPIYIRPTAAETAAIIKEKVKEAEPGPTASDDKTQTEEDKADPSEPSKTPPKAKVAPKTKPTRGLLGSQEKRRP